MSTASFRAIGLTSPKTGLVVDANPEVQADLSTAERVVHHINEVVELPDKEKEEVATAFREILFNAIEHGGRFDPSQNVEIAYLRARHMVICRVKDPGPGFSQEAILHTAMADPPDAPICHAYHEAQGVRPGGYAVLIARHFVDELICDEKGNM
jgi:anti-sigma regulatory factor (Ser/Thr protein kinase)